MCCNRERGTLANSTTKNLCLTESRQSIALNTTLTLKLPVYTLFHLIRSAGDAMRRSSGLGRFSWKATNLRIGIYYKGISIFQLKLYQVFESQHGTWTESIDEIDRVLQIRPTDILDDRKRNELMFDSSLKVSEQYFAILQILRIMREWICDALKDLERQKEIWQSDRGYRLSRKLDESIIESNWEVLVSLQQGFEKILLDRIDRKTEEVKSLRDGLFNATSVLEAQRGTEINQYLFVFTVTTIFYLPVSFVATLFGMHLFDSESLHRTRTSFYVSTVLISVVTYVLSGFAAWWVGNSERRQRLKRYWKSLRAESASETNSETKQASTGKESTPVLAEEKSKSKTLWSGLRSRKHKDNDEEFQLPDLGELNVSTRESHSSSPDLARPTTQ
ncbi:hypothetical protein BU16DRAFT_340064 [Lophium mytilinum]|uniref:Cora-domain-containing protein n=1 Tax=Lophium mytilinum TaxID=390894 RepID=A0A6A6QX98_9PEZI|nr:hypothetical protein BU16DRAFT_340064 [Lophium mytilinum]